MNWQLGIIFALVFILIVLVVSRGKSKGAPPKQ
jgi:hypothetical protein